MYTIRTITLSLPLRMGAVNCYLVNTGAGFVLIDTGSASQRGRLERELASAGCNAGRLDLIVLTHGDFDHMGNAAYLREKFATRIAMAVGDSGMAERGDMFWNRQSGNALMRFAAPILFRFRATDRFKPDLEVGEGDGFGAFGFDARVVPLPGHSMGSIGVLTAQGDLFCGDLLENTETAALNGIMDDAEAAVISLEKLKALDVRTVYPGHGRPFPFAEFLEGV